MNTKLNGAQALLGSGSKCLLVASLSLLAACPSEPNTAMQTPAIEPVINEITPSLVDEVQVLSPEDALLQANEEIDEGNVLDALDALEAEVE